jgi:hypothetical protein
MIMEGAVQLLAFDVGIDVIRTASITLAVLVVALLLASDRYAFPLIARSLVGAVGSALNRRGK